VHVHRIGRTGRAGEDGVALTLVADRDVPRLLPIEAAMPGPVEWADLPPRAGLQALPPAAMQTLAIDGGKQDKLRPGDILGALTGDAGLLAADIGKIDLFPTRAYVAVRHERVQAALAGLRRGKIKGRNFRIRIL
jgi:ATP-independent RNA helicase DbpA